MTARREVAVAVWAGSFASQQLAFAHLLDTAEAAGLDLPLDRVEAVPRDARRRLEHILGPETDAVLARAGSADTLVLLVDAPAPFGSTERLAWIGVFPG